MIKSEYFSLELSLIKNIEIRNDVINILNLYIYNDNFNKAASSTGKYHPAFSNSKHGLVKHTRAVVKLALELLRARPDLYFYRDHIIASCILHDMCKYEKDNIYTVKNHAEVMADLYLEKSNLDKYNKIYISELIRYHQGYFDQDSDIKKYISILSDIPYLGLKDACLLVHYADIIASRKWYSTKNVFIEEENKEEK